MRPFDNYRFIFCVFLEFLPARLTVCSEEYLLTKLFDENLYDKRARPVRHPGEPVVISFSYAIRQLYDVDEKLQTVSILATEYQLWHDHRLQWDPSEFDNQTKFAIDSSYVWTPDTTLYNSIEMYRPNVEDAQKLQVFFSESENSSIVYYILNARHTIGCHFNMKYFPFDTQNCTFIFGSWTQDELDVDYALESTSASLEEYQQSEAWIMQSFEFQAKSVKYQCCPYPYKVIYGHLVIRRKPIYYIFNLVLPTVIIKFLSTFAVFASEGTPENRHDKLQIGITTLLSYCVLLLSVSDQVPKGSSSVPLLGVCFIIIIIHNSLEMFAAVYLSYPHRRMKVIPLHNQVIKHMQTSISVIFHSRKDQESRRTAVFSPRPSGNERERKPETLLMILSMCCTVIISVVMLAIGLTS